MSLLVDSSVWIDLLRGADSREAAWLRHAIDTAQPIIVAGIIATEVLQGIGTRAQARSVERALAEFDRAPDPGYQDCVAAAQLWRRCRERGITVRSTVDCLIAQLAIRYRFIVATKDRDFHAIAKVAPLRLLTVRAH